MLHIVSRSPYSSSALSECLSFADSSTKILLIAGGVYAINHPSLKDAGNIKIYAIKEDVAARGISTLESIELIDYTAMVELTTECHPIQTWS